MLVRIANGVADILEVLIQRSAQLLAAMFFTALGQEVQGAATGTYQPIHAALMVGEPEHLDPLQQVIVSRPAIDAGNSLLFTVGDAG